MNDYQVLTVKYEYFQHIFVTLCLINIRCKRHDVFYSISEVILNASQMGMTTKTI